MQTAATRQPVAGFLDAAMARQSVQATTKAGKAYRSDSVWVYRCADDKIVQIDEFADSLNSARVFGWVDDD